MFFGPCTPYQYRLVGPGSWSKAREAIMTQDERIMYPLKTRKVIANEEFNWSMVIIFPILLMMFVVFIY